LDLDFLLLPGDLTQHGERENHRWLRDRLATLPFPTYVVPGNHDVTRPEGDDERIGLPEFPHCYPKQGYQGQAQLYYCCQPLPGINLIGLNSNWFDAQGKQQGVVDTEQLEWFAQTLATLKPGFTIVMIHHNLIEHLPNQSQHPLSRRYMLSNAPDLLDILQRSPVQESTLIVTGHLHVQDIAHQGSIWEITTGSLVSYPHPYRLCQLKQAENGQYSLAVESPRIHAVPDWPDLQTQSRDWMGQHSERFMLKLLTAPPFNCSEQTAEPFLPHLRYFWAKIADGDPYFEFPQFPEPMQRYFERFNAADVNGGLQTSDNDTTLIW
ncbi:MAG: metallophosphoesterase, partial [Cyanobacteria bacterium P01_H01_bin.121]